MVQPSLISQGVQGSEAAFFVTAMMARDAIALNLPQVIKGLGKDAAVEKANDIVEKALEKLGNEVRGGEGRGGEGRGESEDFCCLFR